MTQAQETEELKNKLAAYEAKTTLTKLYMGLKKQLDDIAVLFNIITIDENTLKKGDDKFFDRYSKMLEKSELFYGNLEKLEKRIVPEEERQNIKEGASVEKRLLS